MCRSSGGGGVCGFRLLVLLGSLLSSTSTLETKDTHARAGPEGDFAEPVDPGACDACETQAHELALGVAAEVRSLVIMAQQMRASTGDEAQPFAEQLLAIAVRIAGRLDQQHDVLAALVAPGGAGGTVSPGLWSTTQWEASNATHTAVFRQAEGDLEQRRGQQVEGDLVLRRGPNTPNDWGIQTPEGAAWDKWENNDKREGLASYIFALVFVGIVASAPVIPHLKRGAVRPAKMEYLECLCLFVWLFCGLYLFTHVIEFQSPHFETIRTLRLEESVYLISQLVTTVGYGDITPAHGTGQLVLSLFVFIAMLVVSKVLCDLVMMFESAMQHALMNDRDAASASTHREKLWAAFVPTIQCGGVFLFFLIIGALFFMLYPGEGKTPGQAMYMSLITLSTVGFGAFTPVTRGGMVFAAYWMLFGAASFGALVSARVAFTAAVIHYERELDSEEPPGRPDSKSRTTSPVHQG